MGGPYPNVSLDALYPRPTSLPTVSLYEIVEEVDGREVVLVPQDKVLSIPGDWSRSFPSGCGLCWSLEVAQGRTSCPARFPHILPFCIGFLNLRVLCRWAFIWRVDVSPTSEAMPRGKVCLLRLRWDLN